MSFKDKMLNLETVNLFDYKDTIEEFKLLEKCIQDNKWHAEGNVLIHTNMVLQKAHEFCHNNVFERGMNDMVSIYLGALLHDFGKPESTFRKENKIVAYGHESSGVLQARDFLKKYFPNFGYARREWILSLVEFHGHPKRLIKDKSTDDKFKRLSLDVNTQQVYGVEVADFTGRIGNGIEESLKYLEDFKDRCKSLDIWDKKYNIPNSKDMSMLEYNIFRWMILFQHWKEDDANKISKIKKLKKLVEKEPFELKLLIGAPGVGKTTYTNKLFPHVKRVSMDEERKRLCGTYDDMSRNQETYDNCFRELRNDLKSGQNVIWDATSATRKMRKRLINLAREQGAYVSIVHFDLSLDTVLERNKNREKVVPEDAVKYIYNQIQSPKSYEYDKLTVIDETVKI